MGVSQVYVKVSVTTLVKLHTIATYFGDAIYNRKGCTMMNINESH